MLAVCLPFAEAAAAVGHRTFSLAAPPDPATFSAVPSVEWERGESLDLNLSGATVGAGQFPRWQVGDVSNLWMDVASTNLSFHATPEAAAIPPGRYLGRVVVTNADSSLVRVLAVQNVRVLPGAPDLCPPEPADTLATTAWVEGLAAALSNALHEADADLAGDLATNALEIAALEEDVVALNAATNHLSRVIANVDGYTDVLYDGIVALEAATNALDSAVAGLHGSFIPMWPGRYCLDATAPNPIDILGLYVFKATVPGATKELRLGAEEYPLVLRSASEDGGITLRSEYHDVTLDKDCHGPVTLDGNVEVQGSFRAPGITANEGENEGVVAIRGYGRELNLDEGFFETGTGLEFSASDSVTGFRFQSTDRVTWNGDGLATTNDIAAAVAPVAGAASTNAAALAAVSSNVAAHAAAFDNPHGVTAAQVGALPVTGGTMTGNLVIAPDSGGNMPWINFLRGTWNDANTDWQIGCSDGNLRFYRSKNGASTTQFMLKDDGTITGNASAMTVNTTTVSAVETRVSDLEAATGEYWCKWPSDSLSTNDTCWIPTNWPARTVVCYAYFESGTYNIAFPSNTVFAPASPHTLHLRVFKTADATVYIRGANGTQLGKLSGSSIIHRNVELAWRPEINGWICTQTHIDEAPYASENDTNYKHVRNSSLPADEFLPWFATNAPANLSLSAPLQTLENPSPTSGETTETGLQGLEVLTETASNNGSFAENALQGPEEDDGTTR